MSKGRPALSTGCPRPHAGNGEVLVQVHAAARASSRSAGSYLIQPVSFCTTMPVTMRTRPMIVDGRILSPTTIAMHKSDRNGTR
jgi:hypothetical protein